VMKAMRAIRGAARCVRQQTQKCEQSGGRHRLSRSDAHISAQLLSSRVSMET